LGGICTADWAATNAARVVNRQRLVELLQSALLAWRRDALLDALLAVGVPAGPINTVAEAFAEAQSVARQMVFRVTSRDGESVPAVRSPLAMTGLSGPSARAAPRLGEHQHESWSQNGP
jgi:crotonobetainyl-CoA:carnitine CoA-transferase CaiB-like acyl-CoA transferase